MGSDLKILLEKLNDSCKRALERASGACVTRTHYEVDTIHLLYQLLDDADNDLNHILENNEIIKASWNKTLTFELDTTKNGNPGRPVFSTRLISCLEDAWMFATLDLNISQIRSATVLAVLANNPIKYGIDNLNGISKISRDYVKNEFWHVVQLSKEGYVDLHGTTPGVQDGVASSSNTFLERYTTNFTRRAREGKIDPVFSRDHEIRQMIDILSRRRKNNPIAVGDAGVGKTAVVEGLALKIAEGDVPDVLLSVDIVGLDLGQLQAGASVKGEFENRLNSVIAEIKSSSKPVILFIDEAHTLIGAGGAAGTNDAANILKPVLARGELKTIAATTWAEYKKYFEKDPALERRFQLVKMDEPSPEQTAVILRGLRPVYESSHNVYIRDDAIVSAAKLAARYITGRQLPDKAVDVLDTACARVKISLTSKPPSVEDIERRIAILARERESLSRDVRTGRSTDDMRLSEIEGEIQQEQARLTVLTDEWKKELEAVNNVIELRKLEHVDSISYLADNMDNSKLKSAIEELEKVQSGAGQISYEVTSDVIEKVISDWTGVPVNKLVKDDIDSIFKLRDEIKNRVRGQEYSIDLIDHGLRTAKAGLNDPGQPLGVFLLVGPSGVGKTETAIALADLMFGGERFMTTINMSEYQQKHTISKLVGSPAGYVGYGEGGILTEAIRQRPYSVLLLDEVEKADLDVLNLFYQVFDKGTLSDGEGRIVDFKNTIIILTSNLASSTIVNMCAGDANPSVEDINSAIRSELQEHFKPALLARMTVVPYYPIKADIMSDIIVSKLSKITQRIAASQKLKMTYDNDVVGYIASRCIDVESGARNVDHIITKHILPVISDKILQRISTNDMGGNLNLGLDEYLNFTVTTH